MLFRSELRVDREGRRGVKVVKVGVAVKPVLRARPFPDRPVLGELVQRAASAAELDDVSDRGEIKHVVNDIERQSRRPLGDIRGEIVTQSC